MLTESQIDRVWKCLIAAEVRALYFAELANLHMTRQRRLSWIGLFLTSGAFGSVLALAANVAPAITIWSSVLLGAVATGIALYRTVWSTPSDASAAARLYSRWNRLAAECQTLWETTWSDDAESRLARCEERSREVSEESLGFPADERRLTHWEGYVLLQRGVQLEA